MITRKYNPDDFPEPVRTDMIALYEAVDADDDTNIGRCAEELYYSLKRMGIAGIKPWPQVVEIQEYFRIYL